MNTSPVTISPFKTNYRVVATPLLNKTQSTDSDEVLKQNNTLIKSENVKKSDFNEVDKNSIVDKIKESNLSKYEILLSHSDFGFNEETKDFYVKVKRGSFESQFPTETMMQLKAFNQQILKDDE